MDDIFCKGGGVSFCASALFMMRGSAMLSLGNRHEDLAPPLCTHFIGIDVSSTRASKRMRFSKSKGCPVWAYSTREARESSCHPARWLKSPSLFGRGAGPDTRARPKRCSAGFRVSFCFSFWRRCAGKQPKQNENETKNTVEVGPWMDEFQVHWLVRWLAGWQVG